VRNGSRVKSNESRVKSNIVIGWKDRNDGSHKCRKGPYVV
jgi:hypothetical protein